MKNDKVLVWEEEVIIPTYGVGVPEKNPMFLENRVYQGSSGTVYPYSVIEKVLDEKVDSKYRAVFLENEYIKVMILPELGGRIHKAYDKICKRDFVYCNHVIKPALVGLLGPWVSGGIEFNWPQHHRPSTFMPVDCSLEKCEDGSAVVWISERERMFHQRGTIGFTLRPGAAYLEITGKSGNPTALPQTFLWWANPAVHVNDEYQSVFPTDVHAVYDHGRRDVSSFPIARGTYYKVDYSAGVDISRYKNIPVPTSFMAVDSRFDFVGGYENDTKAGMLHVADHHVSPGKKQWTWGNGDFGKAWDKNLTDEDGPYIELMAGVFTDNQPDFSWLAPYEEKSFVQYFIPYRELGAVKCAGRDLLMNIVADDNGLCNLLLFATVCIKGAHAVVRKCGKVICDVVLDLDPSEVCTVPVETDSPESVEVTVSSSEGVMMIDWKDDGGQESEPRPEPAKAAKAPQEIETVEQLYLTGLHIEQYRHASFCAADYYAEALKREPGDVRNNNAMGLWLLRKGRFAQAETYFRTAVKTLMERNSNPYFGEPLYNLALALKFQSKFDEAYDWFYKSCWNDACQSSGFFALAQISAMKKNWERALYEVEKAISRNADNFRGYHLKAAVLRHLGRKEAALEVIEYALKRDRFNYGCVFEKYLLGCGNNVLQELSTLMRSEGHNYQELALDYAAAGLWEEALALADWALGFVGSERTMLHYYRIWFLLNLDRRDEAVAAASEAEKSPAAYCNPNNLQDILVLNAAASLVEHSPKAHYYLGNLWYDRRQYAEAVAEWEKSVSLDDTFPTVLRNLSLAYFNKLGRHTDALKMLEKAYSLDRSDARILMELDQLRKRLGVPHRERLDLLEANKAEVLLRDDLYLEYVTLLNMLGRWQDALDMLENRKFHPWEGGEGKVIAQYVYACTALSDSFLKEGNLDKSEFYLDKCSVYPENLGEGKILCEKENGYLYRKGVILAGRGLAEKARIYFEEAVEGVLEPVAAIYYNDQKPEDIYYQGMAYRELGQAEKANECFSKLIRYGEAHFNDRYKKDYFAVSLPDLQIWDDDMDKRNKIHCWFVQGLGHLGLGEKKESAVFFRNIIGLDINHQGALAFLDR